MFKISENANKNYLAKIVKLEKERKHNNADKLKCWSIDFQNVITNLDYKEEDIVVYFPVECQINKDLISFIDGFEDTTMNKNSGNKGFFNKHGRVRAISLRGEKSQGFVLPINTICQWLNIDLVDKVGLEFDYFEGVKICNKYVPFTRENKGLNKGKQPVTKISRLVENQFRLHNDTENLRRNSNKISPEDFIGIHYKKHGTSWVVGNVLVKKQLKWWEKLVKKVGFNIVDTEYDWVYSSRKVVKNEFETKSNNHFYNYDLWADIKEAVKDKIPKGFTLYGEAVGFTKDNSYIQKDYDYGCKAGEMKIYIYRITITNLDGFVVELDDKQVEEFCEKVGLLYKDTFIYYGKAEDLYTDININEHWHENFLERLQEEFNDKNCYICVNKVPEEGIVLRKQSLFHYEAYKLKSAKFLEKETKDLDNNIMDIESQETVEENA